VTVTRNGQPVTTLYPERRVYDVSRMPMTEVAIDRSPWRDLYVALGEPVGTTEWSVRVHHKPLVNWIWGGCLLMALGGFLAVLDRRYRAQKVRAHQPVAVPKLPSLPGLPDAVADKFAGTAVPHPQPAGGAP
jgi:cytochrome c-type biogenesis protein CcmF